MTEVTNGVARVLFRHTVERVETTTQGDYLVCSHCGALAVGITGADHQAAVLAEVGLLRSYDPDAECGVCGGTRDRAEMWRRQANRVDYALADIMPTLRKIFTDATENERQMLDAFDVLIEQARDGKGDVQIAASVPADDRPADA